MLVVAATVLAVGDSMSISDLVAFATGEKTESEVDFIALDEWGLIATLLASLISGLSNALTQRSFVVLPGKSNAPRNPFLYSIELAVYGLLFLSMKEVYDYQQHGGGMFASPEDFTHGWTLGTLIPVGVNACGGIVVGLVVKYAGGIAKGFALIVGIIITGIVSFLVENKPLSPNTG
jgi:solute carrier family 35 (UDP-sugar transporter), member A1/2/3